MRYARHVVTPKALVYVCAIVHNGSRMSAFDVVCGMCVRARERWKRSLVDKSSIIILSIVSTLA